VNHFETSAIGAFATELHDTLPLIAEALETAQQGSDDGPLREAHRLLHSLKGAAGMVGLPAFGYLLDLAEDLVERSLSAPASVRHQQLTTLRACLSQLAAYMAAAMADGTVAAVAPLAFALIEQLRGGADAIDRGTFEKLLDIDVRELVGQRAPASASTAAPLDAGLPGVFGALPDDAFEEAFAALAGETPIGVFETLPDAPAAPLSALSPIDPSPADAFDALPADAFDALPVDPFDTLSIDAFGALPLDAFETMPVEMLNAPPAETLDAPSADTFDAPLAETSGAPLAETLDTLLAALPDLSPESLFPTAEVDIDLEPLAGGLDADWPMAFALEPPAAESIDVAPPPLAAVVEEPTEPVVEEPVAPAVAEMPAPVDVSVSPVHLDLLPSEDVPPELAEVFAQEAAEHLQTIARVTATLSPSSDDRESVQELRRAVHTLKGAAGVVGYKVASKLAHCMEDLLDRLYEGTAVLTPQAVRLLATASDTLDESINGGTDATTLRTTVARLFGEFEAIVGGSKDAPRSTDDASTQTADQSAPSTVNPAAAAADTTSIADQAHAPERRSGVDRRNTPQVLRVPVARLDDLVRSVSELVLNRSTFEQHYAALLAQVEELKFSAARIRKVAQKLEADYEVRALAGNSMSGGGDGWDALEFDRYTDFHLLTRELTETASDIATVSARVSDGIDDFEGDLTRLGRLTREIQDRTLEFRMLPLRTLTTRLERTVRVTADACGKRVEFAIEGEDVTLDKSLLEHMADPLLHLLRNAVDHGIETAERRRAAGKPEHGRIVVRGFHDGTDVVIEVEDDGKGLDVERIRRTAVERGLVGEAEAANLAPDALFDYIFEPGFSTASKVSEISGRGVGMDVVKSAVVRAGGRIQIESRPGAGVTMSIRAPMTLAITRVLLVRAGGQTFGLPLGAVVQIVRPHPTAISSVGPDRVLTVDGKPHRLRDLADVLGLPRAVDAPTTQPVLIANLSGRRIALAVDAILHSRDAVVKSLGTHLRRVPGIWGATLLGDGTVVLILNAADLGGAAEDARVRVVARPTVASLESRKYTVLVVDDSLSMRHVLSTTIKKAGWNVLQARDGLDALETIHRSTQPPDAILLDIEMPRMDGYEFLSTIRANAAYATLPIVMLTSRGSDKHRDKAKALGATGYLVKPFREDVLIETITKFVQTAPPVKKAI
jgi:chemosensory pili system protein ChpA (sensor histidine kinase/response regulator)